MSDANKQIRRNQSYLRGTTLFSNSASSLFNLKKGKRKALKTESLSQYAKDKIANKTKFVYRMLLFKKLLLLGTLMTIIGFAAAYFFSSPL